MIVESIFSTCNLLLVCGSSIYAVIDHSYARYSRLLPRFATACVGIGSIAARSLLALGYKLFIKEYAFDPAKMQSEEEWNKERLNIADEALGTLGMAGLIHSFCCCYDDSIVGGLVVLALSALDAVTLYTSENEVSEIIDYPETLFFNKSRLTALNWIFVGGCLAYLLGSNYAFVANYPLLMANWALPPESFHQGWTIRRTINDYMMACYVIFMTEAIRRAEVR